jgi:transposase
LHRGLCHRGEPGLRDQAFVAALDLAELGFEGVVPERTGRPGYHPATLLKLYVYRYLNRIQSSRRLEREAGRNLELMWLTGRLAPDFKTIADFRKDNGAAIRATCRRFVLLCRELDLLSEASVAVDGSRFKAVSARVIPSPVDQNPCAQSVPAHPRCRSGQVGRHRRSA